MQLHIQIFQSKKQSIHNDRYFVLEENGFCASKGRAMSICEEKNPALEATTFIFLQERN